MIGKDFKAVTIGNEHQRDEEGNWPFALRFGVGGGDVVLKTVNGDDVTVKNIVDGETFPSYTRAVVSVTGTVADIVAVYEFEV